MPRPARRRSDRRRQDGADSAALRELQDLVELAALSDLGGVEVKRIQPSQARKAYICPGCQQEIRPGTAHLVVVPRETPDLRRHWHTPCWLMQQRRRPGH